MACYPPDEPLLDQFRTAGRCEVCGLATPTEPHHVFARGMGGGLRLDHVLNLLAVCRGCHDRIHQGKVRRAELLVLVGRRERMLPEDVEATLRTLRRVKRWQRGGDVP